MTLISPPVSYSPMDVDRLSDRDQKLYELIGGKLVEKKYMSSKANFIAGRLSNLLQNAYPATVAYVLPEQTVFCFADGHSRRPDLCLIWASRLPQGVSDDDIYIVPDLVIEVVSPTNTVYEQDERVEEFLAVGVPLVWVVNPASRSILIQRPDGPPSKLRHGDVLRDEPKLPGLVLTVADIFPPAPVEAPKS
jgi:Uma2 family endonuclease